MRLIGTLLVVGLLCGLAAAQSPLVVKWSDQPGTSDDDHFDGGVAIDSASNCYAAGDSSGDFAGPSTSWPLPDAIVVKYDAGGIEQWRRQVGTTTAEEGQGVAVDAAGNVFLAGRTYGDVGGPNQGASDTFVVKFDAAGNELWSAQTGTSFHERVAGIGLDSMGNSYIGGDATPPTSEIDQDAYLAKVDTNGQVLWRNDYGTDRQDYGRALAVDTSGNSFLGGQTYGDYGAPHQGGYDAFVTKIDSDGNEVWVAQYGSDATDRINGVAIGPTGDIYAVGQTYGVIEPGASAGASFVTKIGADGTYQWTRQFGGDEGAVAEAVTVDRTGAVWITGKANVPGTTFLSDVFIRRFTDDGQEIWADYLFSDARDIGYGIAVDDDLTCYIAGWTDGSLVGPSHGGTDGFVVAYTPEPGTLALLGLGGVALLRRRSR